MAKIIIICIYFGNIPWYFDLFLKSCSYNKDIDFLIMIDQETIVRNNRYRYSNIRFLYYSICQFNSDFMQAFGFKPAINCGYKLCDFRPAFGFIFTKYISNYDFWGYCDIDVIFGQIRNFLTNDILSRYDVITGRHDYLAGCFTLYKNNYKINALFFRSKDYKTVFTTYGNCCFDETNYAFEDFAKGLIPITEIESMTHIVMKLNRNHEINAYFDLHILEGLPGSLLWDHGLLSYKDEYEVLLYHLLFFKEYCHVEHISIVPDKYRIGQLFIEW